MQWFGMKCRAWREGDYVQIVAVDKERGEFRAKVPWASLPNDIKDSLPKGRTVA